VQYIIIRHRNGDKTEAWAPDRGGYVRVSRDGRPAFQPCQGGRLSGHTLLCGPDGIGQAVRAWIRAARRLNRSGAEAEAPA
jgi:hypothetical protein